MEWKRVEKEWKKGEQAEKKKKEGNRRERKKENKRVGRGGWMNKWRERMLTKKGKKIQRGKGDDEEGRKYM